MCSAFPNVQSENLISVPPSLRFSQSLTKNAATDKDVSCAIEEIVL